MFNTGYGNTGDFESLARQYWSAWGEAMRQGAMAAAPTPPPPAGGWQQAVDWWSQLLPRTPSPANDAVARFNQQARDWYGQMQQVAAQFAGRDSTPGDVGQAWRQALGASGANPFPEMFKAMSGKGLHGLDDWIAQAQPFLDQAQQQAERWLHLPAFGQHREQQERLQALVQANVDYQKATAAFNALMGQCAQRAFAVFEDKLGQREAPGEQVTSARALFDLWVDAAELAYAETALSEDFRHRYGALTNAQMRLRGAVQLQIEHMGAQFGMPTRTEVDSAHRKIAELERALRRAAKASLGGASAGRRVADLAPRRAAPARERAVARAGAAAGTEAEAVPAAQRTRASNKGPARPAGSRTAAKRAAARKTTSSDGTAKKSAAGKSSAKKVATKKVAPRKAAIKQAATRKAATRKAATGKGATRKAAATEVAARQPRTATKAAAGGTVSTRKPSRPAAAKKPAAKKPAVKKPAPKVVASKAGSGPGETRKAPATATASGPSKVVSMKDWVARYAAAQPGSAVDADAKGGARRKGGRK